MGDGIHRLPKSRERSIQDLIQFVRNRTDSLANYTLLLGAGASVTSGIRSANALVEEWRREVYERRCSNPIKPYDPSIAKETLIWKQGMASWTKAGDVNEVNTFFAAAPPPLPPQ